MFRIDYKTGQRIYGEDDLNTSTVPHKLAKMRSKTGNYNKGAEAARKMFPHLAVTKDPESEEYVLPVKDAVYPIVEPVITEKVKQDQDLFKKPEHVAAVACDSLWKTFGDVEQFLVVEKNELEVEEGEGNAEAGDDWNSTRVTGRSNYSSLSEDSMEVLDASGVEGVDSKEAVKKPGGANVGVAVAEKTLEEPEEMELGADAGNIAAAARVISERNRITLMKGRDADLDFGFVHEKDLRENSCVFKEEEGEFKVKYVDYYFLGKDPREEFRHLIDRKRDLADDDEMMGDQ